MNNNQPFGFAELVGALFGVVALWAYFFNPNISDLFSPNPLNRHSHPNSKTVDPAGFGDSTSSLPDKTKNKLSKNLTSIADAIKSRHKHFPDEIFLQIPAKESGNLEVLEERIRQLCAHCSITGISVGATFDPIKQEDGLATAGHGGFNAAGHVFRFAPNRYSIWINPSFADKPEVIGAILAHEVAHIYSMTNEISFRSRKDTGQDTLASEQMTDLLTIVLGMGSMTLQGCTYSESDTVRGRVGYLKPEMLSFAHGEWQNLKARYR